MIDDELQQSQVGRDSFYLKAREGAGESLDCVRTASGVNHQLGNHAVVIGRDKCPLRDRGVNADPIAIGRSPARNVSRAGEEVAIRAWSDGAGKTRVRASTLFFDQALDRFFSTLPLESGVEVA